MFLVIMYDIKDDRRRTNLRNLMKSFGAWVQYSGFELDITDIQYLELKKGIGEIISTGDSVRIYTLCSSCRDKIEVIGEDTEEDVGMIF